jgi:hypothetical protein
LEASQEGVAAHDLSRDVSKNQAMVEQAARGMRVLWSAESVKLHIED